MSKKRKGDEKIMPAGWRDVPGVPNAGLEACDGPMPLAEWLRRFGNYRQPIRPGFGARERARRPEAHSTDGEKK